LAIEGFRGMGEETSDGWQGGEAATASATSGSQTTGGIRGWSYSGEKGRR
jgi:hypothetical protein